MSLPQLNSWEMGKIIQFLSLNHMIIILTNIWKNKEEDYKQKKRSQFLTKYLQVTIQHLKIKWNNLGINLLVLQVLSIKKENGNNYVGNISKYLNKTKLKIVFIITMLMQLLKSFQKILKSLSLKM